MSLLPPLATFAEKPQCRTKMQVDEVERGSTHAVRLRAETLQTDGRRLPGGDLHQSNVSGFAALSTPLNNNSRVLEDREKIRVLLRKVRQWIEHHEPSSPVTVLIKQADRMWGNRFSEVAHMITPELIRAWDPGD